MDMFERGNELFRKGDERGAAAAYQAAVDSGHQYATAEAGIKLGIMRRRAGEYPQAVIAYRAAMGTGHPEKAPVAAFLLAGVLSDTGSYREAVDTYEYVIGSGHSMVPSALLCMAEVLRYDLNDLAKAAKTYRRAIDTGDPASAPPAMVELASLLRTNGPEAAIALYERAIASGHVEAVPLARRALREMRGEPDGTPSTRPAAGDVDCLLVLDGDGEVHGLWFEDPAIGDACAADRGRVQDILMANGLTSLMRAGYTAAADHDTGGYRITFQR
ncbi:tetratricopeptide repeat protein [Actinophytocola sp.]|jgi:tetratricopeptide (TPR) repeat protein|uniref:tetratricopeptide repeat protein n=1 Tax=Actinophytocola sp. TaxID=1872138 RepID=UPI002EDA220C